MLMTQTLSLLAHFPKACQRPKVFREFHKSFKVYANETAGARKCNLANKGGREGERGKGRHRGRQTPTDGPRGIGRKGETGRERGGGKVEGSVRGKGRGRERGTGRRREKGREEARGKKRIERSRKRAREREGGTPAESPHAIRPPSRHDAATD